jgi:hypothetical protein
VIDVDDAARPFVRLAAWASQRRRAADGTPIKNPLWRWLIMRGAAEAAAAIYRVAR